MIIKIAKKNHSNHSPLAISLVLSGAAIFSANAAAPGPPLIPAKLAHVSPSISPELISAMQRDFGLNSQQAINYINNESRLFSQADSAEAAMGTHFAGTWIEADQDKNYRVVVATTSQAMASQSRALGVDVRVFKHSFKALESGKNTLDRIAKQRKIPAALTLGM
jgi:streptogrisin C